MMTQESTTWSLLFLLGTSTGLVSGIFGVGGGLLIVPALTLWNIPLAQATATSLVAVLLSAVSGTMRNWWAGQLNLRAALQLALFGIPAAQVGAWLGSHLPETWLAHSFAALLLATIFLLNLQQKAVQRLTLEQEQCDSASRGQPIARIGLIAGVISGLFGIGGGIIMVPLQMLLIAQPIQVAVTNSLGAMVAIAASGLSQHAWKGDVLWQSGLCLGLGGVLGAQVGTRLLPVLPEKLINRLFRLLLLFLALYMAGRSFWVTFS
ncbi:MAG TPA: sulfite exporter TauE/SafE family protein [Coleofasciculaceae cyanobacterium]|jgi:hypothetical protein